MLVSEANQVIVLLPQKTASYSVTAVLERFGYEKKFHKHLRFRDAELPEFTPSWLAYTVIRNPWDRAVSAYEFHRGKTVINPRLVMTNRFREHFEGTGKGFEHFVGEFLALEFPIPNHPVGRFSLGYPQMSWMDGIPDDQQRFARLEDLSSVWEQQSEVLLRRTGGTLPPLPRRNVTKERRSYQGYYTPETREMIATRFARDIEAGGYAFE